MDKSKQFLILAENNECAYTQIAEVRQRLLERGAYKELRMLLKTSALLESNPGLILDALIAQQIEESCCEGT